jgi:hypothetical protein
MTTDSVNSKRPEDSAFKQQRLPSWQPVLTPFRIIVVFVAIGIIFIPIGTSLRAMNNNLEEVKVTYGGDDGISFNQIRNSGSTTCINPTENEKPCSLTIDIKLKEDFKGPVYVYYELENYYQNHRRYVASRDNLQLAGELTSKTEMESCEPLIDSDDGRLLNPCGLIAGSYFTDVIKFTQSNQNSNANMDVSGISWKSDREKKFKQPKGFQMKELPSAQTVSSCVTALGVSNAKNYTDISSSGNKYYCFSYPEDTKYKYLYEFFNPNPTTTCAKGRTNEHCIISPIKGVEDENFIVWMRTAALPRFRKLIGKIDADFNTNEILTFEVQNNYEVASFDATKSLVIATIGDMGGKNLSMGTSYIVVGSVSLFLGLAFFIKHVIHPRRSGDASQLKWD